MKEREDACGKLQFDLIWKEDLIEELFERKEEECTAATLATVAAVEHQHAADMEHITTQLQQKYSNKIESTKSEWSKASRASATELERRDTLHNEDQEHLCTDMMEAPLSGVERIKDQSQTTIVGGTCSCS